MEKVSFNSSPHSIFLRALVNDNLIFPFNFSYCKYTSTAGFKQ